MLHLMSIQFKYNQVFGKVKPGFPLASDSPPGNYSTGSLTKDVALGRPPEGQRCTSLWSEQVFRLLDHHPGACVSVECPVLIGK